jgi:predicted nucleic acid-binding protein
LGTASAQGPLVVAPAVYAELVAAPDREMAFVDTFLAEARIRVDWMLDETVWRAAAHAYRGYAARRRVQADDAGPRRILADFIIGAHAVQAEAVLLTLDARLYRAAFPSLRLRTLDV